MRNAEWHERWSWSLHGSNRQRPTLTGNHYEMVIKEVVRKVMSDTKIDADSGADEYAQLADAANCAALRADAWLRYYEERHLAEHLGEIHDWIESKKPFISSTGE